MRVTAAAFHDSRGTAPLPGQARARSRGLALIWADGACGGKLRDWAKNSLHLTLEFGKRTHTGLVLVISHVASQQSPASGVHLHHRVVKPPACNACQTGNDRVAMNYPQQPHPGYQQMAYHAPPPVPPRKTRWWPWIVVTVLGSFFLLMIIAVAVNPPEEKSEENSTAQQSPANEQSVSAPTTEPPKPAGPADTFTSGVFEVGVDVQPGRYKTPGPPEGDVIGLCYWARQEDDSGAFQSIITNDNLQGPGSVTINAGEFFETSGECTWTKVK